MKRVLAIALWLLSISLSAQVVTSAEFFWGTTDPGQGNATAMLASDGSFDEAVEEVIKAGISLPTTNGIHLFNIRVKDEDGNWGPLFKKAISVENSLTLRDVKVTGAEFFWGTSDPGAGSGTALLAFDNAYDEALETVFKSGISLPSANGIHLFNIRVKDEDGNWGPLFKKAVSIENSLALRDIKVTGAEFFWGTSDPGAGSGTALLAFDNAYDEALETVFKSGITLPSTNGIHLFNIRVKDEDGNWGPLYKKAVSIENSLALRDIKITGAEFFWGTTDPGQGSGTALIAFDNAYDEALETVFKNGISLPSTNGIHLFNIRVKDEDGNWGPLYKKAVSVENSLALRDIKVTGAEFFWGTADPGEGSGTDLLAFDNAYDEALETVFNNGISLPSANGIHLFNIRVKDEDGNWGPLYKKAISIENSLALRDIKVTAAEYFWGLNDPGAGNGTTVLAIDNAFDEALETVFKSGVYPPAKGWNLFNIRAADEEGNWGPIFKKAIWADEGTNPIQISFPSVLAINCFGGTDGEITAAVSGGTAPYTLSWSNGTTNLTNPNLSAGKYVLTVTDATGLTNKDSLTLVEPTQLAITTASTTDVTCSGNDGTATISVSGGTSPYTYAWQGNASTSNTASNLAAGQHFVTVTDANGCTAQHNLTVSLDPASLNITSSSTDPTCFSGSDGTASLTVTGGQSPYTYSWSNGATGASISGLSAGTYTATVTDANSCQSSVSVTLTNPAQLAGPSITSTNPSCTGSNGSVQITNVMQGATYYWYSVANGVSSSAGTGTSLGGLAAGTYQAYGVLAGCTTRVASVTLVGSNASIGLTAVSKTDVTCNGGSDGFLNVSANGGTAPYTYLWSNGATGSAVINLTSGAYTVTVTDANGCTGTATYTISQPSNALSVSLVSAFDVNCFGASTGSITVNASGGQGNYSYAWNNGQTGQQLTGLTAGLYTVTVSDGSGCTAQLSQNITQPSGGISASLRTKNDATCGGQNGAIAVDVVGGTAPYVYSWSNGGNSDSIGGLTAGTYSLTVLDASGCSESFQYTIQSSSTNLQISANVTDVTCFGAANGEVATAVSGGSAPYTFSWTSSVTGFASNSNTLTGLSAGTYTVLVSDASGCTGTATVTVSEPTSAVSVSSTQTVDVSCFGGSNGQITVAGSGGVAPYTYSWNSGQTGAQISGQPSGSYTVTITDANGCTASKSFAVNEPSSAPVAVLNSNDVGCFGGANGTITSNVSGGTAPYTYAWNTGASTTDLSNLTAGSYSLVITDANGCNTSAQAVVSAPNQQLNASIALISNVLCKGDSTGSLTATASGGTAPYTFAWTGAQNYVNTGSTISALAAGNYSVIITDANGCTESLTTTVQEPALALDASQCSVADILCFGGDGSIHLVASGGVAPYSYSWNSDPTNTTDKLTSSVPGFEVFTITDANGCSLVDSLEILDLSSPISIDLAINDVNCYGGNDGTMAAVPTGGTAPYTYVWSTLSTQDSIYNLMPGSYWVNVTDFNGCSKADTGVIGQPVSPISIVPNIIDVACFGDSSGQVDVAVQNYTSSFEITWSTGDTTSLISGLPAGTYTYFISDSLGCELNDSVMVSQSSSILSLLTSPSSPDCVDGANGAVVAVAAGGTPLYTYLWSTGDTTASISALDTGMYSVVVTDDLGCTRTDTVMLDVLNPVSASIVNQSPQLDCFGDTTGMLTATASGGHGSYQYNWSNNTSGSFANGLASGTYWLTVEDAKGCVESDTTIIAAPNPIALTVGIDTTLSGFGLLCYGDSTGQAFADVIGGNGGYSFTWSNGMTGDTLNNLSAGYYAVEVMDSKGCSNKDSVQITTPNQISVNVATIQNGYGFTNDCWNSQDGSAYVQLSTGMSALWSNFFSGDTVVNLAPGKQWVTLTDTIGCQSTDTVSMTSPAEVVATTTIVSNYNGYDISCNGLSDGEASATVIGGVGGYSWSWSNGAGTPMNQTLAAGVTTVTISDALGCTTIDSVVLNEPPVLVASGIVSDLSCYTSEDGNAYVDITGGVSPYAVNWPGIASTGLSATGLNSGYVVYEVVDGNLCTFTDSAFIGSPDQISLTIDTISPSCMESMDGQLSFFATGGAGGFDYTLNSQSSLGALNDIGIGTFVIQVVDQNNCSVDSTIALVPRRMECLVVPNYFSPNADGFNDYWEILGMDLSNYELIVFNVSGQEVYRTSSDNYLPWDGKLDSKVMPDGDYYYVIQDETSNTAGYVTLRK